MSARPFAQCCSGSSRCGSAERDFKYKGFQVTEDRESEYRGQRVEALSESFGIGGCLIWLIPTPSSEEILRRRIRKAD